jgi:diketogulonate reductase-like aldo/keto reductase
MAGDQRHWACIRPFPGVSSLLRNLKHQLCGRPQIILRWLTQRGVVAIPKSVRPERIAENVQVFDVELSPDDMAAIATLDRKESSFFDHRDPAVVKRLGEAQRPT